MSFKINKTAVVTSSTLSVKSGGSDITCLICDGAGNGVRVSVLLNGSGQVETGGDDVDGSDNEWVLVDTYTDPVTPLRMSGCTLKFEPLGGEAYHVAK